MPESTLSLPLLPTTEAPAPPEWHGWSAAIAPEPAVPQGVYGPGPGVDIAPGVDPIAASRAVELLAPAGGPDAAFAAFQFGADAIYLGLKKFSARAEAENFTADELAEVVAYAHSLTPRRRVFVTVNTLVRQDELAELIEDLALLDAVGVDAVIVQDLGVFGIARRLFPKLELHASTQLAVHNRAGAEALRDLGFQRVVLARELTFEEVRDITATSGIEMEVFVHGALCYSYSGLCLFSSQTLGRSGNRGRCAYSCRDSFAVTGAPETLRDGSPVRRDPTTGFPFSMKDLALPDHLPALRAAGVSCFKIEGRKKSPLFVAAAADYYRRLLDGTLVGEDRAEREADLRTVFSRPWTRLFVDSHQDKEVADRDTVGHRGTIVGAVEGVRNGRLRFRTARALERHDGLQVDLPTLGKPFGFPVDHLWVLSGPRDCGREVIQAPAGVFVEVGLPVGHPALPHGLPVYCSSSQEVKRRYRHGRPKPGLYRTRTPVVLDVELTAEGLTVVGRANPGSASVEVRRTLAGPFQPARDTAATETAVRAAFAKTGDTGLELAELVFRDVGGGFVPVSKLNGLRRDVLAALEQALRQAHEQRVQQSCAAVLTAPPAAAADRPTPASLRWSLKIDRIGYVDAFTPADWDGVEELVIDIARDHPTLLTQRLEELDQVLGRDRLRLALPPLTRRWEDQGLRLKIQKLRAAGWHRWEAANVSAWSYLGQPFGGGGLDLAADWPLYVVNRAAAATLLDLGITRFTLSPEDGLANMRPLLAEFGPRAQLIVYQDTPLFLAESCAYANLIGGCPGKANCRFETMELTSAHGERVTALDYHCRTIVLNSGPFCLAPRLRDLTAAGAVSVRADFVYRRYEPAEVRDRWRLVRAGRPVPGGHAANIDRGML